MDVGVPADDVTAAQQLQPSGERLAIAVRGDVGERCPEQCFAAATEHDGQRLVCLEQGPIGAGEGKPDGGRFQGGAQAPLARGEVVHPLLRGGGGLTRVPRQPVHCDGHGDQHGGEQNRGRDIGRLAGGRQRPDEQRNGRDDCDRHRLGPVLLQRDQQHDGQVEREGDDRLGAGQGLDREDGRQRGKRRGSAYQGPRPRGRSSA